MQFFRRVWRAVVRLMVAIFGSLRWQPPTWGVALGRYAQPLRTYNQTPVGRTRVKQLVMVAIVFTCGAIAYVKWPRPTPPRQISITVSDIAAPPSRQRSQPEPPPEAARLAFDGSAAPLESVGKDVDRGLALNPNVAGTWHWESDAILTFTPQQAWPVGAKFTVRIKPEALAPQAVLANYKPQFTTASFTHAISDFSFYQDPTDPKVKQTVTTLTFNYPVDPETLEKRIHLTLIDTEDKNRTPYRFKVTYDDLHFAAYIRSDTIPMPLTEQTMRLEVDKGVHAQAGGDAFTEALTQDVAVPGRDTLHMTESALTLVRNAAYEPEQVLLLTSSAGILEKTIADSLQVYLLPADRPKSAGQDADPKHAWNDPAEITPDIVRLATRLKVTQIPADREYATQHTFKLDVPPGRYVFARVNKGVQSYGGYVLGDHYQTLLRVPAYPREAVIMHDGAVLSVSGERRLNVMTRGLSAVKLSLYRIMPTALNHLISQTMGDFKNPQFRNYAFDEENVSEVFSEVRALESQDPRRAQFTAVDFGPHLDAAGGINHGLFVLKVTAWDPKRKQPLDVNTSFTPSREDNDDAPETADDGGEDNDAAADAGEQAPQSHNQGSDRRFILLTDLGVVVKQDASGSSQVFVQSIKTGDPVADAEIAILGKNGLAVLTRRTDATGMAPLPPLTDFQAEKQPVAYVVRKGTDLSFLPMDRTDRTLDFSRFDVDGLRTQGQSEKLSAFLFSDRGIYRPGDTMHIGIAVKPMEWSRPVDGVPVQLVVTDTRGLAVQRTRVALPPSGFVELQYTSEESAPTGSYDISAYVVHDALHQTLLGSTTVRVEEFMPDRLRITSRIAHAPAQGWLAPEKLQAQVDLFNLFGTPAAQHRVSANYLLMPRLPHFAGYAEYQFFDPTRAERQSTETLDDVQTDDAGHAAFDLDLTAYGKATYELRFFAQGFDMGGGRGVSGEASVVVSPLHYLIGYKSEADLDYLKQGSDVGVQWIAIDPNVQRRSVDKLTAVLIDQRWVSVLARQNNGTYAYQSVRKDVTVSRTPFSIAAEGARYKVPTDKAGTYVLSLRDAEDTELNQVHFMVAGQANLTRSLERNAELQVSLDKRDYDPGETIEVQIKAPYTGAGLITIERDKVLAHAWFKTTSTGSIQKIRLPEGLEGNGYVNVAFVRGLNSPEIFMSPLSYGVAAFSVSRKARTAEVTLQAPQKVQPGDALRMTYSTDRPTKLVLYAVDEGILQVAGYKTPEPLGYFWRKRALEVTTRQILDLILPEYSVVRQLMHEGGDEDLNALRHNLNPFKRKHDAPVVFWSGIVDAGPAPQTLSYQVPDYFNGSLRIMAVAVSEGAMGHAEIHTTVRGPFVINPTTPTFVAPGDVFDASVAIANNVENSGKDTPIEVNVVPSANLAVEGAPSQTVKISEGHEGTAQFRVKALADLGAGELRFTATDGKAHSALTATLSVRPSVPYQTTVHAGSVSNTHADVAIDRTMYNQLARRELVVSPIPLALADGLTTYLDNYPYRCTEQVVSAAVPALAQRLVPEFGKDPNKAQRSVTNAIGVLQSRQTADGAFGSWSANTAVIPFQAVYASHFLLEATEAGFSVPAELRSKALEYVQTVAAGAPASLDDARLISYAIYTLARQGTLATRELAALREYLNKTHGKAWKEDAAAAWIAASYQIMRDTEEAKRVLGSIRLPSQVKRGGDPYYDHTVYAAQVLWLYSKHFPERLADVQKPLLQVLSSNLQGNSYNTLSSAFSFYALAAYSKTVTPGNNAWLDAVQIETQTAQAKATPLTLQRGLFARVSFTDATTVLRITNNHEAPLFYAVTLAGFDTVASPESHGLEVQHVYEDDDGKALDKVKLGQEVTVHVSARATSHAVWSVAWVDLLPSGFDMVASTRQAADQAATGKPAKKSTWELNYADVREDRVVLYGSVDTHVHDYYYKIKAVSRGKFAAPPAWAEDMYDPPTHARSSSTVIEVIAP